MTVTFACKTHEGYAIKILVELLQNNITTGCFQIDQNGIYLRMMDHHRTILIDLHLDANCFSVYKFTGKEKIDLGINLSHLHKMLKTIKKKDSIKLFIDDRTPNDLFIKVTPKENTRSTTSSVKIQTIQNLDIDLPDGYGKPVIVPSGEFQKMCKGLNSISSTTHILSTGFTIRFSSDAGGVMKRYTDFGETDDSDNEDVEMKTTNYSEMFDTEQLVRITKLSGLNSIMQIYPKTDNPLMFKSFVGSLGFISIYLKSKSMQEKESHSVEDEY